MSNTKKQAPVMESKPFEEPKSKNRIDGSDLIPDIETFDRGTTRRVKYWVGLLPSSPSQNIILGGISFPRFSEKLLPDPGAPGEKRRVAYHGCMQSLTRKQFDKIAGIIKRTMFRFTEGSDRQQEPGTGENMGDPHERKRKGWAVTIPTKEQIAKGSRPYDAGDHDEYAAEHVYMIATDEIGADYPLPLSQTGLEWPEE